MTLMEEEEELPASRPASPQQQQRELTALKQTNALLERMGFGERQFSAFEELVASVSSMSVAIYEKLFAFRLADIVRVPTRARDYEHNAQCVVDALAGALLDRTFDDRVTGQALCAGDVHSIQQLIAVFAHIKELLQDEANGELVDGDDYAAEDDQEHARRPRRSINSSASRTRTSTLKKTAKKADTSRESVNRSRSNDASRSRGQPDRRATAASLSSLTRKNLELRQQRTTGVHSSLPNSLSSDRIVKNLDESFAKTTTARKKRSRVVDSTSRRPSNGQSLRGGQQDRSKTRVKQSSTIAADNLYDSFTSEQELLATQKYGRFVPVPSNIHPSEGSGDAQAEGEQDALDASDQANAGAHVEEISTQQHQHQQTQAVEDEDAFFGGMSSVSIVTGNSVHFIEENADFDPDFSPPNSPSHSQKAAEQKQSDEENQPSMNKNTNSDNADDGQPASKKNANQLEAETNDVPVSNPIKKKSVRHSPPTTAEKRIRSQPSSAEKLISARTSKRESLPSTSSLYPVLPPIKRASSNSGDIGKARTEFLRYKLSLKDRLQELRQKEYCQRQHLERVYKAGEHTANVERIRSRRFEQDLRLHRIAIGLEIRDEEEKQLRDAMQHLLQLEKEKLREEHRATSSVLKQIQKEHAEREKAMETFYANQIQLVKERTHREVKEREVVEKAHRMASEQMMREMRREREHQLAALLQEKQHLEEARRVRSASRLATVIQKGEEEQRSRPLQADAFYAAAMKARQLRGSSDTAKIKAKRASIDTVYSRKAGRSKLTSQPMRRATRA